MGIGEVRGVEAVLGVVEGLEMVEGLEEAAKLEKVEKLEMVEVEGEVAILVEQEVQEDLENLGVKEEEQAMPEVEEEQI